MLWSEPHVTRKQPKTNRWNVMIEQNLGAWTFRECLGSYRWRWLAAFHATTTEMSWPGFKTVTIQWGADT